VTYAAGYFDSGAFLVDLARRVGFQTETGWLRGTRMCSLTWSRKMAQTAHCLGATARVLDNPDGRGAPFLAAHRREAPGLPTVLTYGPARRVARACR
jgi:hypothetical protein